MTDMTAQTTLTTLTAIRSKHHKTAPAHVWDRPADRPWAQFDTLCGDYLKDPETLPWENTTLEDRCPRCVKRLDQGAAVDETGVPIDTVKPANAWWSWLRRIPGGDLIYRHTHTHAWRPHGVRTWPSGRTSPAYQCCTCGATASDMSQGYGGTDPDTGLPERDTRTPKEDSRN